MALGGPRAPHRIGTNGTAQPKIDTSVDLAAEFGVDEARLRRAVDRNWLGAGKAAGEIDELEKLLKPEPIEPVSIAQALAELPRLLDPARHRRMSGGFRPLATPSRATSPTSRASRSRAKRDVGPAATSADAYVATPVRASGCGGCARPALRCRARTGGR